MGKNGYYVFDQDDYEDFLRKGRIIAALRNAIVNHYEGFEVNYQPIVDCQTEAAEMCREMQKYIPNFKINVNVSYVQILQGNVERFQKQYISGITP